MLESLQYLIGAASTLTLVAELAGVPATAVPDIVRLFHAEIPLRKLQLGIQTLSKVPDTPEWILVHVVAVIPRPIGEITAQSAVIPDLVAENRRRPFTPAQRDIVLRLIADRTPTAQAASAARLLAPLCGARAHRD